MGEAKRRKAIDPNFGKMPKLNINQAEIIDELVQSFIESLKTMDGRKIILESWEITKSSWNSPILVCHPHPTDNSEIMLGATDDHILHIFNVHKEARSLFQYTVTYNLMPVFFITVNPQTFVERIKAGKIKEVPEEYTYQLCGFKLNELTTL